MKITTFNPMILSKDADEVIKLFEKLGFKKTHAPTVSLDLKRLMRRLSTQARAWSQAPG